MQIDCGKCHQTNRVPAARLHGAPRCGSCHASITMDRPHNVRSAADFDELISASKLPVLVDFWAAWCPPCRAVAPEFEKLAKAKTGSLFVAKVDTEMLPDIAARYAIRSIPTFIRFDGGKEAQRASGAMPAAALERQFEF